MKITITTRRNVHHARTNFLPRQEWCTQQPPAAAMMLWDGGSLTEDLRSVAGESLELCCWHWDHRCLTWSSRLQHLPAHWKMKMQENRSGRVGRCSGWGFSMDFLCGYQFHGEVKTFPFVSAFCCLFLCFYLLSYAWGCRAETWWKWSALVFPKKWIIIKKTPIIFSFMESLDLCVIFF